MSIHQIFPFRVVFRTARCSTIITLSTFVRFRRFCLPTNSLMYAWTYFGLQRWNTSEYERFANDQRFSMSVYVRFAVTRLPLIVTDGLMQR